MAFYIFFLGLRFSWLGIRTSCNYVVCFTPFHASDIFNLLLNTDVVYLIMHIHGQFTEPHIYMTLATQLYFSANTADIKLSNRRAGLSVNSWLTYEKCCYQTEPPSHSPRSRYTIYLFISLSFDYLY